LVCLFISVVADTDFDYVEQANKEGSNSTLKVVRGDSMTQISDRRGRFQSNSYHRLITDSTARRNRKSHFGRLFSCVANVRFWPKADTRGRILGPKIGNPAFFGLLSVR
jgi:hypothetical protein